MNSPIFGFALLGTGMISRIHANAIKQLNKGQLIAVCDRNHDKVQQFAAEFGCEGYTHISDLLARKDIHIVSVCTPSRLHSAQVIACAQAGKHVITEKPMAITWNEAQAMIAACRQANVKLAVISQHRLSPDVIALKQLITEGRLGQLLAGNASINWYRTQDYYDSGSWRGTKALDGGGALLNQGIHTVDLLQYLMGSVTSVHAHTRTIGHEHIDVEDIAAAVLTYADGGIGTLFATTCAYPGLQTRIEIFGQRGSAILENNELVYVATRDGESDWSHLAEQRVVNLNKKTANPEDAVGTVHRLQLQDLIDAIDQDREPIVNGEEGAKPLQIILSAYASASKGLPIYL